MTTKSLHGLALTFLLLAAAAPVAGQNPVEVQFLISREIAAARVKEVGATATTSGQVVALLSGVLIASPEDFEALLQQPHWIAKVRTPAFAACTKNLEELARMLALTLSPLNPDRKAVEDYFRQQGKPEWARTTAQENQLLVSLAAEVAQEAALARLYAQGEHSDPDAQAIRKHRQFLTNMARQGQAGVIGAGDPLIVVAASRYAWGQTLLKREQLAYMLSSVVCVP